MSALAQTKTAAKANHGSGLRDGQIARATELRELIHAQMYFVSIYANVVRDLAGAGDDAGITYGLEKLALYTKTALSLRFDLEEAKKVSVQSAPKSTDGLAVVGARR